MAGYIDLHLHTNRSDGMSSPAELLAEVTDAGLAAFSVTDHDTLDGLREVMALRTDSHPQLISGVELSVHQDGCDVHLLGYGFDIDNAALNLALRECAEVREQRGRQIVEKLQSLGLNVAFEEVAVIASGAVVGRPHIAEAMMRCGAVRSYEEAFSRYIGTGKPAYVPKKVLLPSEAINLVHQAGGVAVLAHPALDNTFRFLDELMAVGLDGIEVYHSSHSQSDVDRCREAARRHRLVMTGGSDYHGRDDRHGAIGSQAVPAELLPALLGRVKERREIQ